MVLEFSLAPPTHLPPPPYISFKSPPPAYPDLTLPQGGSRRGGRGKREGGEGVGEEGEKVREGEKREGRWRGQEGGKEVREEAEAE